MAVMASFWPEHPGKVAGAIKSSDSAKVDYPSPADYMPCAVRDELGMESLPLMVSA